MELDSRGDVMKTLDFVHLVLMMIPGANVGINMETCLTWKRNVRSEQLGYQHSMCTPVNSVASGRPASFVLLFSDAPTTLRFSCLVASR